MKNCPRCCAQRQSLDVSLWYRDALEGLKDENQNLQRSEKTVVPQVSCGEQLTLQSSSFLGARVQHPVAHVLHPGLAKVQLVGRSWLTAPYLLGG